MSTSLQVLIVEDEPIIRVYLSRLVKSKGHTVVATLTNAQDALHIIEKQALDLIFMDINLEGKLDGISAVRQISSSCKALIYFISAYNDMETIEEALSTKANNFINKPIKEEDIFIALTLAKKNSAKASPNTIVVISKDLIYDKETKELFLQKKYVKLTKTEKLMIDLFIENINANISQETLINYVWEDKEVSASTIRSSISVLRKKLPTLHIENNVGRGYTLVIDSSF